MSVAETCFKVMRGTMTDDRSGGRSLETPCGKVPGSAGRHVGLLDPRRGCHVRDSSGLHAPRLASAKPVHRVYSMRSAMAMETAIQSGACLHPAA